MDAKRVILDTFNQLDQDLERALDGLTPEELSWRPDKGANSIGFTLWHLTRAEDVWVHKYGQGVPQLFDQDGWAQKWGILPEDTGFDYNEEKLASFPTPPLNELMQYHQVVRQDTLRYLEGLTPEALDLPIKVEHPRRKGYSIGRIFSHLVCEIGQHVGHIRYLRGLQRGLNQ